MSPLLQVRKCWKKYVLEYEKKLSEWRHNIYGKPISDYLIIFFQYNIQAYKTLIVVFRDIIS